MRRRLIHVITPGDHFSPRTGSAIPTVVHGLSLATPLTRPRPLVLVAMGTYPDRYDSADVSEYAQATARRRDRYLDPLRGRIGAVRRGAQRQYAPVMEAQDSWEPSVVVLHNAVAAVRQVETVHRAVLYAHNDLLRTYGRRELSRCLERVAAVVCVSDALSDLTRRQLPGSLRDRVHTVRNGVDLATFGRPVRERGEILQVTYVGRMTPYKGPDLLVEALRLLGRDDIHLTLVGGDGFDPEADPTDYERHVRSEALRLPGGATITAAVPRGEVAVRLVAADVVVVPSRWPEPFALTVLEGMAAGAAVIGADTGGIPESVGGRGLLFTPGDSASLAARIAELADDPLKLQTVRTRCREHAQLNGWESVHRRLDQVLDGLE